MFTKEEIRYYVENGVATGLLLTILGLMLSIAIAIGSIQEYKDSYKEGYLQGQIDYRKGWINIKQDTLTNWKLK